MSKTKRILSVLLAGALMASMAACGSGGGSSSSEGTAPAESGSSAAGDTAASGGGEAATVNIFQFKVEVHEALKAATEAYMKENPNVKINLETVGGGDDYGASLRTKMASSEQPVIYNVGGPQDVLDWTGKMEDLSGEPWVPNVVSGLLDDVSVDGKIYGLPFAIEGYGFIFNKEIFEAAGIDLKSASTYADIDKCFSDLKAKIDAGELKDKYPALEAVIEFPVKEKWVTGLHTGNIALGQEFKSSTESFNAKTVEFKYAQQLKDLIDMQVKYTSNAATPANLNAVDYSMQIGGGLAIERVAVVQQGNWVFPEIKSVDEAVADKMDLIPMPLNGVSEGNIPVGVPMYWCVNSERPDNEKNAAKDFLNWLYQSDAGKNIVVNEMGFIPPFTNYGDITPSDPLGKAINEYANQGKTAPWVFMGEPTGWGENTLGVGVQKYVAGEQDWDAMIQSVKDDWAAKRAA